MKQFFLSIALVISFPVLADWKYIATENESESEFFLDFETLRKDGNLRRIWQLVNLKADDKYGSGSMRSRMEFDCKNETIQGLSLIVFADKFANGKVIRQFDTATSKSDVAPNTVGWTMLKEVCKR